MHLHIQLFNFCKFKSRALESFIGVQHITFLWISSLQLGVSHLQDPIERDRHIAVMQLYLYDLGQGLSSPFGFIGM